jgi:DNA-directed RNA polymerase alpha subunit
METRSLFELSKRSWARLMDEGIKTPEDLKTWSDKDILTIPGIGRKGLNEIKNVFPETGCNIQQEPKWCNYYSRSTVFK